ADYGKLSFVELEKEIVKMTVERYIEKRSTHPVEVVRSVEKQILLYTLDNRWKEHLLNMDHLREGINLRSYAERKPLTEFKKEGFRMFDEMLHNLQFEVVETMFQVKVVQQAAPIQSAMPTRIQERHDSLDAFGAAPADPVRPDKQGAPTPGPAKVRAAPSIGRNDPCYCGSGKKYKHCHYVSDVQKQAS
ncbi:MAG: SEC-C domain-containing protein, partial [Spirochaetia bacterium]|nr:SEC-C domain-containing protein [Spirochaetia bacterium]